MSRYLFLGNVNLASTNGVGDGLGALAIDLATDGVGGTENLLHDSLQRLGERLEAHGAGNVNDLVEGHALVVLDVLLLLAVARGLLQRTDDKGRSTGHDGDGGLTVLDGELDRDTEALPVASSLGDVFTNFLGRQTQRTDLGGKSGRGTNLTSGGTEVAISIISASSVRLYCARHRSRGTEILLSSARG